MSVLTLWQFNFILYLIFVVAFFQFYKMAVRKAERDGAATVLLQLIAGGSILFLSPLYPFTFPKNYLVYLLLFVASIFYALNDRLQTTVRKNLEVSVFSILSQMQNVFLISIGFLIFREELLLTKVLGAGLILFANIFLFYEKGKFRLNQFAWLSVLASFIFSIALSIDVGISKQFNLPFYIMITLVVPALMIFFTEKIRVSDILIEHNSENRKFYYLTGIFWGLAIFFSLRSFKFGEVTTIVPLSATSVLLNVLVAYVFLGEKDRKIKKIISAILVIAGIYITTL